MLSRKKVLSSALALLFALPSVRAETNNSSADVESRVNALLKSMTIEEKITLLGGTQGLYTSSLPRLGVPSLRMSDGPVGVHDFGDTTAYPAGIALAASWDTDLARQVGESMGKNARARGIHFILGPGLNIYRAPMAGRNFEYLGEDPFLASRIVVPLVEGIQSQGVIATAKHFMGNNQEYDRQKISSDIDERSMREIYLPAFEAAVKEAKLGAIMDAYNLVNGVYMTANNHLNDEVVKQEWGFDGIVMSDWTAAHDAVADANGGLDLEMPSAFFMTPQNLLPAIQQGKVSIATIDDKVRRILRKMIQFGFLDRDQMDKSIPLYSQDSREIALKEAREGMVLLKNDNHLLPMDRKQIKTIAVIGPDAYPAVVGGGGSSSVTPFNSVSFLEGISNYLGSSVKVISASDFVPLDDVVDRTRFLISPGGPRGLKAEYFDNLNFEGTPAKVQTDQRIAFDWGEGSYRDEGPSDHFSIRWTGYFVPDITAAHKFQLSPNGDARLYVDDHLMLDTSSSHAKSLAIYTVLLQEGKPYKIRLEYLKNDRTGAIHFGIGPAEQPPVVGSGGRTLGIDATEAAARADAVVLCVGFNPWLEGEASDRTFRLPGDQDELIRRIAAINNNVIVVISAGGNVDMTQWVDKVSGIIHAWYPGQEGGTALAQLLFGEFSPSGKLPVSFERKWEDNATFDSYYPKQGEKHVEYKEGVFLGYRNFDRSATKPLFPFGFGLSYTTFGYDHLRIAPSYGAAPVTVSFDVTNTSNGRGAEIAELYVGDPHASVPRPVKELKGFARVDLAPGETRHVSLSLDRRAFSFYDVRRKDWNAEPGLFSIIVGGSSADIRLQGTFELAQ